MANMSEIRTALHHFDTAKTEIEYIDETGELSAAMEDMREQIVQIALGGVDELVNELIRTARELKHLDGRQFKNQVDELSNYMGELEDLGQFVAEEG